MAFSRQLSLLPENYADFWRHFDAICTDLSDTVSHHLDSTYLCKARGLIQSARSAIPGPSRVSPSHELFRRFGNALSLIDALTRDKEFRPNGKSDTGQFSALMADLLHLKSAAPNQKSIQDIGKAIRVLRTMKNAYTIENQVKRLIDRTMRKLERLFPRQPPPRGTEEIRSSDRASVISRQSSKASRISQDAGKCRRDGISLIQELSQEKAKVQELQVRHDHLVEEHSHARAELKKRLSAKYKWLSQQTVVETEESILELRRQIWHLQADLKRIGDGDSEDLEDE
jgi:hypothetical protein